MGAYLRPKVSWPLVTTIIRADDYIYIYIYMYIYTYCLFKNVQLNWSSECRLAFVCF